MKAISIKQPWITLILGKSKTIELRDMELSYRGPIALHAPKGIDYKAAFFFNIEDPLTLSTGFIMGVAEIVDVIVLNDSNQLGYLLEHFQVAPFNGDKFGLVIKNVQVLQNPIPQAGQPGIFDLPADITESIRNQINEGN
ncbi:MAG: hypothetical protein HOP10_03060 [Chitinophagaceae bacterium]|nr:hypothetical protein [Chitinophagaceae bacterium]